MLKLSLCIGLLLSSLLATAQAIESSRSLANTYQAQALEQATNILTAANRVGASATIEYKAGQAVVLQPGFEAKAGSVFTAHTGLVSAGFSESGAKLITIKAYPNPFDELTTITYELTRPARTSLQIHDAEGRLVSQLVEGQYQEAGRYEVSWKGGVSPAGTYVCVLNAGAQRIASRIIKK